jgi:hypothetical protein
MREIAEIEMAIQGGTEKIESLGTGVRIDSYQSPVVDFPNLGEQGKVEESMREMAAIEALKSEKADKEVRFLGEGRLSWMD